MYSKLHTSSKHSQLNMSVRSLSWKMANKQLNTLSKTNCAAFFQRCDKHVQSGAAEAFLTLSERLAWSSHLKLKTCPAQWTTCHIFLPLHLWTHGAICTPALPGITNHHQACSILSEQRVIYRSVSTDCKYLAFMATLCCCLSVSFMISAEGHAWGTNCSVLWEGNCK